MINKIAAYSLILLANITLLVHAVIPHHHHHEVVCIISSHCETDAENFQHSIDGHHHDQNGDNSAEYCALSKITAIKYNQVKHDYDCSHCQNNFTFFTDLTITNIGLYGLCPTSFNKTQQPLFFSNYTSFSGASFSLRGPPIV